MIQELINNSEFLRWYFNPRGRIAKKPFIIIVTVISLLLTALTYMDKKEDIEKASNNLAGFTDYKKRSGSQLSPQQAIAKIMSQAEGSDEMVKDLGEQFGVAGFSSKEDSKPFSWIALLKVITYIAMTPLIMMRIRDIGKKEGTTSKLASLIMLPFVFDLIEIIGINISLYLYIPAFTISFVLLSWACLTKSQEYIPPSQRREMPEEEKVARPDPKPINRVDYD